MWFLDIAFVHKVGMCVSAYKAVNNYSHDMKLYWLIQEHSSLIMWQLPSVLWMGVALLTKHIASTGQMRQGEAVLAIHFISSSNITLSDRHINKIIRVLAFAYRFAYRAN